MGTDIYGAIEVRELIGAAALDQVIGGTSHCEAPWVHCMDLYPLYPGGGYSPMGCLFGVRNWNGWELAAEGRGLPADVSDVVREDYDQSAETDAAIGGSTWVSWPELRDLDMTVTSLARGVLEVNESGSGVQVVVPPRLQGHGNRAQVIAQMSAARCARIRDDQYGMACAPPEVVGAGLPRALRTNQTVR